MPAAHRASPRLLVLRCGVVPVLLIAVFGVFRPALLARLDDSVYDIMLRSAPTKGPAETVAIVDVDDRSLSSIGQWPWRRDVVGRLITSVRNAGASVIALDMIFAERDRFSESEDVDDGPGGEAPTTSDAALAAALRGGRVILGYGFTFDRAARPPMANGCGPHPIGIAIVRPPAETRHQPVFQATGAVCNLRILSDANRRAGFLNAAPDSDGILRRVPLVAELDGRVYPSLALAAVAAATGTRDLALRVANVNAATLTIDDRNVPVDGKANLLLRYRGKKRTFPYVSAADVLTNRIAADALRGKIVFVGTTALGTREVVATPLDTLFAGVEVQATVADNLLTQDFVSRTAFAPILESLVVILFGIAVAVMVARVGIVSGMIGAAATVASLWAGSEWLLSAHGVFVSPLFPTLGVVAAHAVMTLAKITIERGRADVADREKTSAQRLMVQTLLSLTEVRDAETGRHSRRTQQYARLLAEQLATQPEFHGYLTQERIDLLSSLAPLHDIGKVGVPDRVLNKPGALTPEELTEMRTHPALGREVILRAEARVGVRDDATLQMAKDIVYTHHERWDGAGYPEGLRGAAIPVAGRVMAVVDVYDAAHARTLYRACLSHDDTVALIVRGRGTHFDPAVVDAFLSVAGRFKSAADEAIPG